MKLWIGTKIWSYFSDAVSKKNYFLAFGLQKDSPPARKFTANKDIEKTEQNIFHQFRLSSVLSLARSHIKKCIIHAICIKIWKFFKQNSWLATFDGIRVDLEKEVEFAVAN